MKPQRPLFLALVLGLVAAGAPATAQKQSRTVQKHFETTGAPRVEIDSRFGDVTVIPAGKNAVDVKVDLEAEAGSVERAKEIVDGAKVDIDGSSGKVRIEVRMGDNHDGKNVSLHAAIHVALPPASALQVENKFGAIDISGVTGSVRAEGKFGNIELTRCANVDVENAFGDIRIANITGKVNVEGKNGRILAHDIAGGTFENAYGEIEIAHADAPVSVESKMGNIEAKGIPGGTFVNKYGGIDVSLPSNFSGTISAHVEYGDVDSDFPLESQTKSTKKYGPTPEDYTGKFGSGEGMLKVSCDFGSIRIRKK